MTDTTIVQRLRNYGLTLEESVVICDRRVVDEAADEIDRLTAELAEARKLLGSLLRLTVFELQGNAEREPWKRAIARCRSFLASKGE